MAFDWKKMTSRTFIERSQCLASKNRLFLLGAKTADDFNLKVLIYCIENPRALNNYAKPTPVVLYKRINKA